MRKAELMPGRYDGMNTLRGCRADEVDESESEHSGDVVARPRDGQDHATAFATECPLPREILDPPSVSCEQSPQSAGNVFSLSCSSKAVQHAVALICQMAPGLTPKNVIEQCIAMSDVQVADLVVAMAFLTSCGRLDQWEGDEGVQARVIWSDAEVCAGGGYLARLLRESAEPDVLTIRAADVELAISLFDLAAERFKTKTLARLSFRAALLLKWLERFRPEGTGSFADPERFSQLVAFIRLWSFARMALWDWIVVAETPDLAGLPARTQFALALLRRFDRNSFDWLVPPVAGPVPGPDDSSESSSSSSTSTTRETELSSSTASSRSSRGMRPPPKSDDVTRISALSEFVDAAELGQMTLCFLHARKPDDPFTAIFDRLLEIRASQAPGLDPSVTRGIGRIIAHAYCARPIEPRWVLQALKRFGTQEGLSAAIARKAKIAHDFTEEPFGESPVFLRFVEKCFWAASLLVFPVAWYVGSIPAVVDAELSVAC
jgi:hypothetical protein